MCFGGEESAGASFLRLDGTVWSTDKDGLIMDLLAAEITARTGKDPGAHYQELEAEFGTPYYTRIDAPATPEQKSRLSNLSPEAVTAPQLAGEPIRDKLTNAPGNNAPIGGLKVVADSGWFAARPSGTENIYKIYAESFQGSGPPGRDRQRSSRDRRRCAHSLQGNLVTFGHGTITSTLGSGADIEPGDLQRCDSDQQRLGCGDPCRCCV